MASFIFKDGKGFEIAVTGTIEQVTDVQKLLIENGDKMKKIKIGDKVKVISKSVGNPQLCRYNKEFHEKNGYLFVKDIVNGDEIRSIGEVYEKVYIVGYELDGEVGDFALNSDLVHYD